MSGYLVAHCTINYPGQGSVELKAGTLVTDPVAVAGVAAAGGVLAPGSTAILAAVAICNKLRGSASQAGRGQNEDACDNVMMAAFTADVVSEQGIQRQTVTFALAALQALTSGTPFNLGPALPANARLLQAELLVNTALAGNTSDTVTVQASTGDSAGAIIGATPINVFTGGVTNATSNGRGAGSDPYMSRGGQQIQATITGGSALSGLSAGSLTFNLYYQVIP